MSDILVLNQSYVPIARTNTERAICLLLLNKAISIKDSDKEIRSQFLSLRIPEVIVLKDCNHFRREIVPFSRKAILNRDSWICFYCGDSRKHLITLDHIIPRSRWEKISKERNLDYSQNSFENCIASCRDCNTRKSDSLPEELGWKIPKPSAPISDLILDWAILYDMGTKQIGEENV